MSSSNGRSGDGADPAASAIRRVNRVLLARGHQRTSEADTAAFQAGLANLTVLHWPDRDEGPLLLLANDVSHPWRPWRHRSGPMNTTLHPTRSR